MTEPMTEPHELVSEAEKLFATACERAGSRLTALARDRGLDYVNERDHLQPIYRKALEETVRDVRPRPSVSLTLDHGLEPLWPALGRFDIALSFGRTATIFGELKSGREVGALSACAWDAAKCVFCLGHGVGAGMLLVAAAPAALWRTRCLGLELFDDGNWDTADVRRRYARGFTRWEKDGYKPVRLPAAFTTSAVSRAEFPIAGNSWMLGVARVEPLEEEWLDWQPFLPMGYRLLPRAGRAQSAHGASDA